MRLHICRLHSLENREMCSALPMTGPSWGKFRAMRRARWGPQRFAKELSRIDGFYWMQEYLPTVYICMYLHVCVCVCVSVRLLV